MHKFETHSNYWKDLWSNHVFSFSYYNCNIIYSLSFIIFMYLSTSLYITVISWVHSFLCSCCLFAQNSIIVSPKCLESLPENFDGNESLSLSSVMVDARLEQTNSVLLLLDFWKMLNIKIQLGQINLQEGFWNAAGSVLVKGNTISKWWIV